MSKLRQISVVPVVNFTNILWAHLHQYSCAKKSSTLKCKYKKASRKTFARKGPHNIFWNWHLLDLRLIVFVGQVSKKCSFEFFEFCAYNSVCNISFNMIETFWSNFWVSDIKEVQTYPVDGPLKALNMHVWDPCHKRWIVV